MKRLLNTLYITTPDAYLSVDGENIVVLKDQAELGRVPLHNLDGIVSFGYTGASPALMYACAKRNVSLVFLSMSGRFLARVIGEVRGNVTLRKAQYRISDDELLSAQMAKSMIVAKLYNSRWVLERATRDYPMRLDIERIKKASDFINTLVFSANESSNLESLRGIEGEAASLYFGVLDELILQQKDYFKFVGRNRRPPKDNVNALLSFAYTLLANMVGSALETVGLDPYVGFLHRDRPGRISLALDLMEELRSVYADRFVLTLINKKIVNHKGFIQQEDGAIIMTDATKKAFLDAWQEKKKEMITHPFLDEKIEWGMVPHVQALLLARTIRGDLDTYPPFLWK